MVEESLLRSKGKFIYVIERKHMLVVIWRRSPIACDALIVLIVAVAAAVRIPGIGKIRGVSVRGAEGEAAG